MVTLTAANRNVHCEIQLPASKSLSNRVLIIRALCGEDFEIKNLSEAYDTRELQNALNSISSTIDAGDGGTTLRFLLAYLSLKGGQYTITGSPSLSKRPNSVLTDALISLGVIIDFPETDGMLPLTLTSTGLTSKEITIDGSVSSQFVSALMLVAPYIKDGLKIRLSGEVISLPYILMTKSVMEYFEAHVDFDGELLTICESRYKPKPISIEPDWSAASYWYEIVALSESCSVLLKGLSKQSLQGDAVISEMMHRFGVNTEFTEAGALLTKQQDFQLPEYFSADFSGCPDLGPAMAVTCGALNITADLLGLKNFRLKESDRASSIQRELYNFNIKTDFCGGSKFKIYSGSGIRKSKYPIKTYNDHRIAMAFAPLALKVGGVQLENEEVVAKSYPRYFEDIQNVLL